MDRIKDGAVMPFAGGEIARVVSNAQVGGKVGAGRVGAAKLVQAVEAGITKANGGNRPDLFDTKFWETAGPLVAVLATHGVIISPVGKAMPDDVLDKLNPIVDYMEIGAFSDVSADFLTPIANSLVESFATLPGEALNAMKVVDGGREEKKAGGK